MQNAFFCSGRPANLLRQLRSLFYTAKDYILEWVKSLIPYDRCLCPCGICHNKTLDRKSIPIVKNDTSVDDNVTLQVLHSPQAVDKILVDEVHSQLDL